MSQTATGTSDGLIVFFSLSHIAERFGLPLSVIQQCFDRLNPMAGFEAYVSDVGHLESKELHGTEFFPNLGRAIYKFNSSAVRRDLSGNILSIKLTPMQKNNHSESYVCGINNRDYHLLPRLFFKPKWEGSKAFYLSPDRTALLPGEERELGDYSIVGFDLYYSERTLVAVDLKESTNPLADAEAIGKIWTTQNPPKGKFSQPDIPAGYHAVYNSGVVIGMVPDDAVIPMTVAEPELAPSVVASPSIHFSGSISNTGAASNRNMEYHGMHEILPAYTTKAN